ncbi:hypothetical protein [Streptosporangium canum]|uniref:hypothetical protein n=1 Tax=Streptosporangium canum TaxID=324952 RepID=UPI0037B497A5
MATRDDIAKMQNLVADLDGQQRREREAYEQGYRDGHRSGWDIGHGHAEHEMSKNWSELAGRIRAGARHHRTRRSQ